MFLHIWMAETFYLNNPIDATLSSVSNSRNEIQGGVQDVFTYTKAVISMHLDVFDSISEPKPMTFKGLIADILEKNSVRNHKNSR